MKNKELAKHAWARPTVSFFSAKNNRRQWCESILERDYLLTLEFDRRVLAYRAQPVCFHNLHASISPYTPDVLVKRVGGLQTEEVKPDKFVDADLYRKLGLINEAMLSQRWPQLTLVKASQFDVGDRIRNVRILYGYRRGQVRTPVIQTFISSLPSSLALGELRARARSIKDLPKSLPLTIIANGIYTFDLSVRYSDDTVLERCQ